MEMLVFVLKVAGVIVAVTFYGAFVISIGVEAGLKSFFDKESKKGGKSKKRRQKQ